MNITIKVPQKSRVFPENPYNTTGLSDNNITSPIKPLLSSLSVNFGKKSQDKPNFAARVGLGTVQKTQKTTAIITRCGFVLCK